ncbi:hypothetical protein [Ruegeria sp. HKCCD8929]|uniref:hypothetical protein n=1 Tax=Ruegeria sp. HKCCD8929 TaxID=2683006 RepID=UPI001489A3A4|nr:hypothetical protein [Ruegeria sp. HKCCD8929]
MIRTLALVTMLAAESASAQTPCPAEGGQTFALFETAKLDFLKGDYKSFHAHIATLISGTDYEKLFNPLILGAPDGFSGCTTVLQRVETGGMVQELVLYELPNGVPLGLYLLAAPVRGELSFLSFQFSTSIGDVLDELR